VLEAKVKGCYSIKMVSAHKALFVENGGNRNVEARGDVYFVGQTMKH